MAAVLFRRLSAFHRSIAGVFVFPSVLPCGPTLYSVFYRTYLLTLPWLCDVFMMLTHTCSPEFSGEFPQGCHHGSQL